ncbi:MAG TPA: M48 family metalloprotease [Chloroflexota bacterium]
MSTLVQAFPGVRSTSEEVACPERDAAATRLGAERRRVFALSAMLSLLAPVVPYLTGAWENAWFLLAATPLPFVLRVLVFLGAFHLLLSVMLMPVAYYSGFVLAHAFGLSRQTPRAWLVDWLKGTLLGAVLGSAIGAAFIWTVGVFGSAWWVVFGVLVSVVGVALVFLTPYVLVPLFFKMRPLADTATVERIQVLVKRAGAPVRDVCSLDFSRRTAEANAAVIGIGRSRRVVIADTLLAEFSTGEVDAVVAHELGHHVERHVQQLLLGNAVMVWIGLALAAWLAPAALPVLSLPRLDYVPGYPVVFAVTELYFVLIAPLMNWWSRRLETHADRFALDLTQDPSSFAAAMQRIGCQNLVEYRPPRWAELLLASHPALHRRVALARSWSDS